MLIYKLTSPSNKSYVGLTTRKLELRINEHKNAKNKSRIGSAFSKYTDLEEWQIEILEICDTLEELYAAEIKWIDFYNSYNEGYNGTMGGEGFRVSRLTEEHKKNLSKSRKEYFKTKEGLLWKEILSEKRKEYNRNNKGRPAPNKGKKTSAEVKAKLSIAQLKRYQEHPECREQVSRNIKKHWKNGAYNSRAKPTEESINRRIETLKRNGFKQTEYQKKCASEANKGRPKSEETKAKLREKALARKTICPHCFKEGDPGPMQRWHFNNCRNQ